MSAGASRNTETIGLSGSEPESISKPGWVSCPFRTRALGRQAENPFQIRNGKVHFGIVNYFLKKAR